MKILRLLVLPLALTAVAVASAADPSGTWAWTVHSPSGELETKATLRATDGKLAGTYANEFGESAIGNATLADDLIAFDVVRDFGGNSFVVKYRGKLEGETIKGTIEMPGFGGGEAVKVDWSAKRTAPAK